MHRPCCPCPTIPALILGLVKMVSRGGCRINRILTRPSTTPRRSALIRTTHDDRRRDPEGPGRLLRHLHVSHPRQRLRLPRRHATVPAPISERLGPRDRGLRVLSPGGNARTLRLYLR